MTHVQAIPLDLFTGENYGSLSVHEWLVRVRIVVKIW